MKPLYLYLIAAVLGLIAVALFVASYIGPQGGVFATGSTFLMDEEVCFETSRLDEFGNKIERCINVFGADTDFDPGVSGANIPANEFTQAFYNACITAGNSPRECDLLLTDPGLAYDDDKFTVDGCVEAGNNKNDCEEACLLIGSACDRSESAAERQEENNPSDGSDPDHITVINNLFQEWQDNGTCDYERNFGECLDLCIEVKVCNPEDATTVQDSFPFDDGDVSQVDIPGEDEPPPGADPLFDCYVETGSLADCMEELEQSDLFLAETFGDQDFEEFSDLGYTPGELQTLESELLESLREALNNVRNNIEPTLDITAQEELRQAFRASLCEVSPVLCDPAGAFAWVDNWYNQFCAATPALCQDPRGTRDTVFDQEKEQEPQPTQEDQLGQARLASVTCASGPDQPGTSVNTHAEFNGCLVGGQKVCLTWEYSDGSSETVCGNANNLKELQEILDEENYLNFMTDADRVAADGYPESPPSVEVHCGYFTGGSLNGITSMIADAAGYDQCRQAGGVPCIKETGQAVQCDFVDPQAFLNEFEAAEQRVAEQEAQSLEKLYESFDYYLNLTKLEKFKDLPLGSALDLTPEQLELFDLYLEQQQSQTEESWQGLRDSQRDETDPERYRNSFGGEFGYLGTDPTHPWDSWNEPGQCVNSATGEGIGVFNSRQAGSCFARGGFSFVGPDGNTYANAEQLNAQMRFIQTQRSRAQGGAL